MYSTDRLTSFDHADAAREAANQANTPATTSIVEALLAVAAAINDHTNRMPGGLPPLDPDTARRL